MAIGLSAIQAATPRSEKTTPSDLQLVSSLPDGVQPKNFVKSGIRYFNNPWYGTHESEFSYSPVQVAKSADKVYISAGKLQYEKDCYLVGTIGDYGIVTFQFPQWVGSYTSGSVGGTDTFNSYLAVFEYKPSDKEVEPGYLPGTFVESKTQTIQMRLTSDGELEVPEDFSSLMIGEAEWCTKEYNDQGLLVTVDEPYWKWQESGEIVKKYKEFTQTPNTVPDGVSFEDWTCIDGGISKTTVGIGMHEDAIYVRGLLEEAPELVLIGSVEEDKVTFNTTQYMGVCDGKHAFFLAAKQAEENGIPCYKTLPYLIFDFDRDNKEMTTNGSVVISSTPDRVDIIESYDNPSILISSESGTVGKNLYPPKIRTYKYGEDEKQVTIILPIYDKGGNELNKANCYYTFFIDGKPLEITNPPYRYAVSEGESITEIPYNADGDNLYAYGQDRVFFFFKDVNKSFAVQMIYKTDDFESKSDMVYAIGSPVPVLTPDNVELEVGKTTVLQLGFSDKKITDEMMEGFKAEIVDTKIAKIVNSELKDGSVSIEVEAIAPGETYLTADIDGENTMAGITVYQETIQISPVAIEMKVGELAMLELSIKEKEITENMMENLKIEVADEKIVQCVESALENGKVNIKIKGLEEGETKVIIEINGKSVEAVVTVKKSSDSINTVSEENLIQISENEILANGYTIHVYSVSGILLSTGKDICDISTLSAGLYIVETIDLDGGRKIRKFTR